MNIMSNYKEADHEKEIDLQWRSQKDTKGKYNDLQVKCNEISGDLDYSQLLFSDQRDYEEIKLRNKKLENDLIHSNERHLTELSKVRENLENQIKYQTTGLQNEINELRQNREEIDLEYNQHIDELNEVIASERDAQKNRFQDIVQHFENILRKTATLSSQLVSDFNTTKLKMASLKNQTNALETNLKKEFTDNLDVLKSNLPFSSELHGGSFKCRRRENQSMGSDPVGDDYGVGSIFSLVPRNI